MNIKLVIIDDEPMVVKGLSQLVPWDEIGCEVVATGEDGETGVALVRQYQPDLVISDIQMPKLSGLEMIKALHKEKQDVRFILLTGFRQFEYAKEALDLGVAKFLLKPTNIEEMKKAVVEVIQDIEEAKLREDSLVALKRKLAAYEEGAAYAETIAGEAMAGNGEVAGNGEAAGNGELVAQGAKNVNESPRPAGANLQHQPSNHLMRQAIDYMRNHYGEKLDLQTVADQLFVSIWHLSKLFKKEIGSSFIEVLNEIRIVEAKRMLAETNMKIYEIGEKVGYMDNPYFTKIFKKYTGVTPNQYRNGEHVS